MTGWLRHTFTPRRLVAIVVLWAAAFALLSWLDFRPQPLGLFAIVGFIVLAHAAYTSANAPWLTPLWRRPTTTARRPTRTDGRLRFIRRIAETAVDRQSGSHAEYNARRLQSLLRDIARDRLLTRADLGPTGAPDLQTALRDRSPALHTYLFADPAPQLNLAQIRDIVDRIEDL